MNLMTCQDCNKEISKSLKCCERCGLGYKEFKSLYKEAELNAKTEEEYRELQFIWHSALEYVKQKRNGLAIRIFREGIALAIKYNDQGRLNQLYRDCGEAYRSIGEFEKAKEMFIKAKEYVTLGTMLFGLSKTDEALYYYYKAEKTLTYPIDRNIYHVLFFNEKYVHALNRLESRCKNQRKWNSFFDISIVDTKIALIGLSKKFNTDNLLDKGSLVNKLYKGVYRKITLKYGSWKNAIVILSNELSEEKKSKLTNRIKPQNFIIKADMYYNENEVNNILLRASKSHKHWVNLTKILNNVRPKKYADARTKITEYINSNLNPNENLYSYAKEFLVSLYIVENQFEKAIECMKEDKYYHDTHSWNDYLNLLLLADLEMPELDFAEQYIHLIDKSTPFLYEHFQEFVMYCKKKLSEFKKKNGLHLLKWIAQKYKNQANSSLGLFIGFDSTNIVDKSPFARYNDKMYDFYAIPEMEIIIKDMLNGAENKIRDELGIPQIGEGWVSEAEMVNLIKEGFAPHEVIPQGSPKWLGSQRFDVYIPDFMLAIEYQGIQHYKVIDFFGGEKGFEEIQRRDKKKLSLAELNGVKIEYIKYDENITEKVNEIIKNYRHKQHVDFKVEKPRKKKS